ncbi:MAG: BrnA antitoxin family protein [Polaromonas sp.]|nr:BrnA antitoxin family protein [Polaromonas sp.]
MRHIAEAQDMASVAEKVEAAASKSDDGGHPTTEVTLWLDVEVVDKFKAYGDDWQTRINDVLRVALERGALKAG